MAVDAVGHASPMLTSSATGLKAILPSWLCPSSRCHWNRSGRERAPWPSSSLTPQAGVARLSSPIHSGRRREAMATGSGGRSGSNLRSGPTEPTRSAQGDRPVGRGRGQRGHEPTSPCGQAGGTHRGPELIRTIPVSGSGRPSEEARLLNKTVIGPLAIGDGQSHASNLLEKRAPSSHSRRLERISPDFLKPAGMSRR